MNILFRMLLAMFLISGSVCMAELFLPTVFSDHMILQREQPVPVWGIAAAGTAVTVEFAGQTKTTVTDSSKHWETVLDPMPADSKPRNLVVRSPIGNREFSDVLVGEVWFCAGQSNMQMSFVKQRPNGPVCGQAEAEIAAANYPQIRLYNTPRTVSFHPVEKINAQWCICTPKNVKTFSACAYFFGRKLHQDLNVPVGLLLCAWGNTRIEGWVPPCGFESVEALADVYRQTQNLTECSEVNAQTPGAIYNGMFAAHIPFAIRGAIWYQGENNRWDGMRYVDKTRALLNGWRKLWGTEFPFYFVQIGAFDYKNKNPEMLPLFWEAQSEIVKVIPNTGMAVITDVSTLDDIHPPNKKDPGIRLALLAEAKTYGMDAICTGPVFQALEKQERRLKVVFSSAVGLTTRDGKAPDWFEIAGENGVFKPAGAEIEENSVILGSPDISDPVLMRFAWNGLAQPNLVNEAGLPVSAFRAAIE